MKRKAIWAYHAPLLFSNDFGQGFAGFFRRWKHFFEGKGIGRFTVSAQVSKALLRLLYTGDVTGGNPPEGQVGTIEALKPLAALLQHLTVLALVDKS